MTFPPSAISHPPSARPCRAAFTLIELLTVMAIIAILMGMLFPIISSARARAYDAQCASNLKQIGTALYGYATSVGNGYFPYDSAADCSIDGQQKPLLDALAEYIPVSAGSGTVSSVWFCPRYVRTKSINVGTELTASRIGYFYWAWKAPRYPISTTETNSHWQEVSGLAPATNLPAVILVSDRFEGPPLPTTSEVQFHAGASINAPLARRGTHMLFTGGTVLRLSPTRGAAK